MALNPNIALQGQRPEFTDPLSQYAKIAQVKNLLAQGPLHTAQAEKLRLETEQTRLENEGLPAKQAAATKAAESLARERDMKAQADELDLASKKAGRLGSLAGTIKDEPTKDYAIGQAMRENLIPPGAGMKLLMGAYNDELKGQIEQFTGQALSAKDQHEQKRQGLLDQIKQAEESRAAAAFPLKQRAEAAQATSAEQKATGTEPIQPKDAATIAATAARNSQLAGNEAELRKQGAQRVGIAQQELAVRKQQVGFETSGGISTTAQMIAKGEVDPQTVRSMLRRNAGILSQVKAIDPNFDEAGIDNRYATLKEFNNTSTSKAGGQSLALNTLIHHADLYLEAADALKNGSFKPGNAIYNRVSELFGSPAPQNASLVARFLAGETGKVATGGVPAEGEIKGILKSLGTDASPDQIAGAGKTLLQIAAGRATPLMERAKQAKIDNVFQVLGPDAKDILKRRGFDPDTMKPASASSGSKRGTFNPATGKIEYQ